MSTRYQKSEDLLAKALQVTPLGCQTFSKSYTQYPHGVSPYFIEKANGAYVWDIDGNQYLDCVNGLLAVSLGYCDPDIDKSVMAQIQKGITFSLASELEYQLACKLIELIPCAEMVRYGKNGTDATSGAIRMARAITGKDRVLVCGYHGWQDWYIGSTTKDLGVPQAIKALTHHFVYNDLDSLEKLLTTYKDQVAAVIMEPMGVIQPNPNFLQSVKELTHSHNALLIFDEIITGFRFSLGGAQAYFNVTPDLATFGKGMANGYPISVLVGKKQYMESMKNVFLSSTFGGEALSLAASYATITKMQQVNFVQHLNTIGQKITLGVKHLIQQFQLEEVIALNGHPAWTLFSINDCNGFSLWEIKSLFMQECLKRDVLTLGSHNTSYAYKQADVDFLLKIYGEVFSILKQAIFNKKLYDYLECKPIQPLFKIR